MNILITGSNGQLGNCIQELQHLYPQHQWFNTDVEQLDITKPEQIRQYVGENQIDGIVNCAAYTAVDRAEDNEELATLLNAEAPAYLAHAIAQRNGWFIQISTDYVFDGKAHQPYNEEHPTNPQSVYGKTKLVGEFNALKFCQRTVIIRTAWLYSAYGHNFVKTMMNLGRQKEQISVVADQHGTPTSAHDLAGVIMQIIEQGIIPGTYHYTNLGQTTWYAFASQIMADAQINCKVLPITTEQYPTPAQRPAYSVLDKTKIQQVYHLNIPQWEDSLKTIIMKLEQQ